MPSDKRELEIKREAKQILDKFAKALSKIKKVPESFVERDSDRREERGGEKADKDFIDSVFENAPQTKNKCILAERGKWK